MNYTKVATGIYERPSGRLQVAWRAGGRLHRELLAAGITLTEAKAFRRRKLGDAAKPQQLKQAPTRCTFETLVELLAAEHALHRRSKPLNLAQLTEHFAGRRATQIDAAALEAYVVERRTAGAADATIRNQIGTLRHALRLAKKKGWLDDVPDIAMPEVQNVRECYFTETEVDRLLALLPRALRSAVEFAALTGLRRANVYGLTWDEVRFDRSEIALAGVQMKNGSPLAIPLTLRLIALLRAQQRQRSNSLTVFARHDKLMRKAWPKAVGSEGLDKWGRQWDARVGGFVRVRPRFHDLRHSFAQHMIDSGVDEGTVMALGGWKTRAMLERYAIKTDAAKRRALAQRDAHLRAERQAAKKAARVLDLLKRRTA